MCAYFAVYNVIGVWKCTEPCSPLVVNPAHSGTTGSIPCLLMTWLLASPCHQRPWNRLCRTKEKHFSDLCLIGVKKLVGNANTFLNSLKYISARQRTWSDQQLLIKTPPPLDKMSAISQTMYSDAVFVNEKFCILIKFSLKSVPKGPIHNNPTLV